VASLHDSTAGPSSGIQVDVWKRKEALLIASQQGSFTLNKRLAYGLRKRSNSALSRMLSEALTVMWRRTVSEILGEKPSGVLWQREQFCRKMRDPASSCFLSICAVGWLLSGCGLGGLVCVVVCAIATDELSSNEKRSIRCEFMIIFPSRLG
jgi:hypothetical protein